MAQPQLQSGRMTRSDCLEEFWNYFTFSKSIVRRKKIWQDNRFCWRICFLSKFIFESGKASTTPNAIHFGVFFTESVRIQCGVVLVSFPNPFGIISESFRICFSDLSIQLSSLPPAPTRPPAVELFRYLAKLWLTKLHHFPTCSCCCWLAVVSSPLNIDSTFCVEFTGEKASVSCCCCFQAHDIWSNDERIFAWVMMWC